jgi:hypothetical protein
VNNLRWFNPSQPQTLQIGVLLLYLNAFFNVLNLRLIVLAVLMAAGAIGIANEKRWGYVAGLVGAIGQVLLLVMLYSLGEILDNVGLLITFMFDAALVGLLAHPMSRDYQRIWFR